MIINLELQLIIDDFNFRSVKISVIFPPLLHQLLSELRSGGNDIKLTDVSLLLISHQVPPTQPNRRRCCNKLEQV